MNIRSVRNRIPLPSPEELSPAQREVYDTIVSGRRGRVVGPLRAILHNPELADRWQTFGEILRYLTSLPSRLTELAILVTARRWNSELEWGIHARAAREAGLDDSIIDALRLAGAPKFNAPDEQEIYEYVRQLQTCGQVSDEVYAAVWQRWKEVGIVELTAIVGYYTMVAMTLNAHQIPIPDDVTEGLPSLSGSAPPTLANLLAAQSRG